MESDPEVVSDRRLRGTRGELLALLRRGERTALEIAEQLGLTPNAVRQHLASLESERLIEPRGLARGVSKPSRRYGLSSSGRLMFSRAHGVVVRALLAELRDTRREPEALLLLEGAGRRLARGRLAGGERFVERLGAVVQSFRDLGGDPVVERDRRQVRVLIHHCPLADVASLHPEVCVLACALVSELTGVPVEGRCTQGEHPSCRFELVAPPAARSSRH